MAGALPDVKEVCLRVEGTVQGVGFRPFVYRLARRHGVRGWILNDSRGVLIRAAAAKDVLDCFERDLHLEAPPAAHVDQVYRTGFEDCPPDVVTGDDFTILSSQLRACTDAPIPPDLAVCPDCLREMRDPTDRRYRYPFINCTNCGPRYSILEKIPYDRPGTTMKAFPLCRECRSEYENPADRRFHAQPLACPDCGPHLDYRDRNGEPAAIREAALACAIDCMRAGGIVAVKGIGGFHLMCDAASDKAVSALRERKHREEKPFAVMTPDLSAARSLCFLSPEEEWLLSSVHAPIVLALRRDGFLSGVSRFVAPENPMLGVMLPYAPLHHLMMETWNGFFVATSGNLSDEPICIDEAEAYSRLKGIADGFLIHNRPIARPVDDSVVRVINGEPVVLRRARGYAPAPIALPADLPPLLAVGAHLKNTVAVTSGGRLFPSQHIGDLSTPAARDAFSNAVDLLSQLYSTNPDAIVCDLHPDYPSTHWAEKRELPVERVQHHHAHVMSCLAQNQVRGHVLGVSWDGTGYGPDGTIWGGEWLVANLDEPGFRRHAALRTFPLPGGEAAIRRPVLAAVGLLWSVYGEHVFARNETRSILGLDINEQTVLKRMLVRRINAPETTSAGRLFDGVAALLGLGGSVSFEAQAAMKLEFLAAESNDTASYPFSLRRGTRTGEMAPSWVADWAPIIACIIVDIGTGTAKPVIARRFHNTLATMIRAAARKMRNMPVALTGGCFQNKILFETTASLLEEDGFQVFGHGEVPPNDGGVAIGQIVAAAAARKLIANGGTHV